MISENIQEGELCQIRLTPGHADKDVFLHILADCGKFYLGFNIKAGEDGRVPDARYFKKLWRFDRTITCVSEEDIP